MFPLIPMKALENQKSFDVFSGFKRKQWEEKG